MITAEQASVISNKNHKRTKSSPVLKLNTIDKNIRKASEKGFKRISYNAFICEIMAKALVKAGYKIVYPSWYLSSFKHRNTENMVYEFLEYGEIDKNSYHAVISWE